MWLDDPVTLALTNYLDKEIKSKTLAVFNARRSNPAQLSDVVFELELATRLKETINKGEFYR